MKMKEEGRPSLCVHVCSTELWNLCRCTVAQLTHALSHLCTCTHAHTCTTLSPCTGAGARMVQPPLEAGGLPGRKEI